MLGLELYLNDFVLYRYEPLKLFLRSSSCSAFFVTVYYRNFPVNDVAGRQRVRFVQNECFKICSWPIPYNPVLGKYKYVVYRRKFNSEGPVYEPVAAGYFCVAKRNPKISINKMFKVLTVETAADVYTIKPSLKVGKKKYKGLSGIAKFLGVDAVFYLAGQTVWGATSDRSPWLKPNINKWELIGQEVKKANLLFGAWVGCFLTFGKGKSAPSYNWALQFRNGKLYRGKAVSVNCKKRIKDIISLVKRLQESPYVDFVGLDYIRTAFGGYEMADEFLDDMCLPKPYSWNRMNQYQKALWLVKRVSKSKTWRILWSWWKARKLSLIIRYIKKKANVTKPMFGFILGWEWGHEHGQDPSMFIDAGLDLIMLMLYESNHAMFANMMQRLPDYKLKEANILLGEEADWILLDQIHPGPAELYRRLITAVKTLKCVTCGMFVHDYARMLWGRKGPYPAREWLAAAAACYAWSPEEKVRLDIPSIVPIGTWVKGKLSYKNSSNMPLKLDIIPYTAPGVSIEAPDSFLVPARKSTSVEFKFKVGFARPETQNYFMVAFKLSDGSFVFKYVKATSDIEFP